VHDQSGSGATLFIEPIAIVDLNNQWREAQLAEQEEIHRILAALTGLVAAAGGMIVRTVEGLGDLDLIFAKARYAYALHATEPELIPFRQPLKPTARGARRRAAVEDATDVAPTAAVHPGSMIHLVKARHPLLDPETVVPIDVVLDEDTFALVITGPNTGGKTVTLKTVGLLAIMAQSGMQIPAQSGSTLSIFKDIFADIGDEQSIEQSLSTFSGHITQLVSILKRADAQSLVLLDELGAGTDPQEGSALAMSVLTHLLKRRITCMVATHYPELKAYAHTTPHVVNASVEFDLQTLKPTYHLTIGLPGRSNALLIAERLGLSHEIISAARAEIDPADLKAEDLLEEIHRQRDLAQKALQQAEDVRRLAETRLDEASSRLDKVEEERVAILEKARSEAACEVETVRSEMEALRRELARARQPLEVVDEVEEKLEEVAEVVEKPVERKTQPIKRGKRPSGPVRLGEKVHLKTINQDGIVTSLGENNLEVQVGVLRVRARLSDITRKTQAEEPEAAPVVEVKQVGRLNLPAVDSPGVELDIRGQRVEEALESLQRYLERAYMAGLPYVRIIHGKGTGKLRQAIRDVVRQSPHVARWEAGGETEGGDGVTVAMLRSL